MVKQAGATLEAALRRVDGTTLRFLVTGASGAALFFSVSFIGVSAGLPPFGGTLLAYAIAFVAVYTTQQAWTFRGRSRHTEALPRYLAVQVGCALFSAALARLLATRGGLSPFPMAALTTLITNAISYGLVRYWVFRLRG